MHLTRTEGYTTAGDMMLWFEMLARTFGTTAKVQVKTKDGEMHSPHIMINETPKEIPDDVLITIE